MTDIFSPIRVGRYDLKNRVFMAPLTRGRTGAEGVPGEINARYYAQRATAGLIIAEATAINQAGKGWPGAPGIFSDEQVAGWKQVADAVHEQGGRIFVQIWHMGRAALPVYTGQDAPVSASPIAAEGAIPGPDGVPVEFPTPRPLTKDEISEIVQDFAQAAKNAVEAGLDGVEIHAANNFLLDSFLRDGTNERTDEYGGSPENRARFLIEVVEAVSNAIGADRTGVRFSPTASPFGIRDSRPAETFAVAAEKLNAFELAYLHILEVPKNIEHMMSSDQDPVVADIRKAYNGTLILNGQYDKDRANASLAAGAGDAVSFGYAYVANPDLVARMQGDHPLATANDDLLYTPDAEGYSDYPALTLEPAE
ncbi:hypothetical protein ACMU_08790 [Actibacterium mucosum KCTC 23349]|uniref:NADH:flavin oxidoreductase/NADH oxidase N-terminal domain-containing protein n=1 Tax=Actibacterium mucosum KCTC 23349 TaxID=1454373 RepID=A0A037ZJS6_9RHOB|nr:alkene reductase [Actibacterium mucosum]KAJ55859.1 hypothetical protein ACMU_08790 [Actibacterium mucosum KCTC 23349]